MPKTRSEARRGSGDVHIAGAVRICVVRRVTLRGFVRVVRIAEQEANSREWEARVEVGVYGWRRPRRVLSRRGSEGIVVAIGGVELWFVAVRAEACLLPRLAFRVFRTIIYFRGPPLSRYQCFFCPRLFFCAIDIGQSRRWIAIVVLLRTKTRVWCLHQLQLFIYSFVWGAKTYWATATAEAHTEQMKCNAI